MDLLNNENVFIVDEEYPNFFTNLLTLNGYKLNKNQLETRTLIDWNDIKNKYSRVYYFEECEKIIKEHLLNSVLNDVDLILYVEFGPNEPMIKISGDYFVQYWDDFVLEYGSMGTTIISENGKYVLEFTDDTDWLLYANFSIPAGAPAVP